MAAAIYSMVMGRFYQIYGSSLKVMLFIWNDFITYSCWRWMHSGCIDELTIFIIAYAGGSSTEKGFFAPPSPCLFTLSPRGGEDTALGHQLSKSEEEKPMSSRRSSLRWRLRVQVLFFLPAHMNLHGRHNSNDDSQRKCDSQNGQGVGRNRMLAAVPSFEVMSGGGQGSGPASARGEFLHETVLPVYSGGRGRLGGRMDPKGGIIRLSVLAYGNRRGS